MAERKADTMPAISQDADGGTRIEAWTFRSALTVKYEFTMHCELPSNQHHAHLTERRQDYRYIETFGKYTTEHDWKYVAVKFVLIRHYWISACLLHEQCRIGVRRMLMRDAFLALFSYSDWMEIYLPQPLFASWHLIRMNFEIHKRKFRLLSWQLQSI